MGQFILMTWKKWKVRRGQWGVQTIKALCWVVCVKIQTQCTGSDVSLRHQVKAVGIAPSVLSCYACARVEQNKG